MRRSILATAGVAVVAFDRRDASQLWPAHGHERSARAEAKAPCCRSCPPRSANRKPLIVGVKCDTPPFGYLDVRGKNRGRRRDRKEFARRVRNSAAPDVRPAHRRRCESRSAPPTASTSSSRRSRTRRPDTGSTSRGATTTRQGGCSSRRTPIETLANIRARGWRRPAARSTTAGPSGASPAPRRSSSTASRMSSSAFNQGGADAVMSTTCRSTLIAATDPQAKLTDDCSRKARTASASSRQCGAEAMGGRATQPDEAEGPLPPIVRNNIAPRSCRRSSRTSCGRTTTSHVEPATSRASTRCARRLTHPRVAAAATRPPLACTDAAASPTTSGRSYRRTGASSSTALSTPSRLRDRDRRAFAHRRRARRRPGPTASR